MVNLLLEYFNQKQYSQNTVEQRWSRGHKARGQGQAHKKISRPRTEPLEAKAKLQGHRRKCSPKKKIFKKLFQAISKKKGLKKFFSGEIGLQKIFFRRSPREENRKQKKVTKKFFREVSGVFQQNFNGSKNSAVLEPRTGQFLRT